MIDDVTLGDLADALSRGRLTLAELAVMRPAELNALFELACERLDTERDADAGALLACLVALFPYDPRYWRAYGIALHRRLDLDGARAAYDAAIALAPDSDSSRCYRGEVALYQEDRTIARRDLEWVVANGRPALRRRALALLEHLEGRAVPRKRGPRPVIPDAGEFTLTDLTPLPLKDGRFTAPLALDDETTVTAIASQWLDGTSPGLDTGEDAFELTSPGLGKDGEDRFDRTAPRFLDGEDTASFADGDSPDLHPASETWTARLPRGPSRIEDDDGDTARVRRRRADFDHPLEPIHDGDTGKIRREPVRESGDGDTARIRREPKRDRKSGDTDLVTRVRIEIERNEPTEPRADVREDTAIARRRRGEPLSIEEEEA